MDDNHSAGWIGKDLYTLHPEYKPLGINPLFEGPGMSGQGGNAQVTAYPKPFIIFPSAEAAIMYKVDYIQRYDGNWARWGAREKSAQENYRTNVMKMSTKIVDSLLKANAKATNDSNANKTSTGLNYKLL